MTVNIEQADDSPEITDAQQPSVRQVFKIVADASETDDSVRNAFLTFINARDFGFGNPTQQVDLTRLSKGLYVGDVTFSAQDAGLQETGDRKVRFEVQGNREKVTDALTQQQFGELPEGPSPDVGNAIGVGERGVDGVEIIVPSVRFSVDWIYPGDTVNPTFRRIIADLVGKINDAPAFGYSTGEVLLAGASLEERVRPQDSVWDARFDFLVSRDATFEYPPGLVPAGDPDPIPKPGWSFLWVQYQSKPSGASGVDKPQAVAVYVAETYEQADFTQLQIDLT